MLVRICTVCILFFSLVSCYQDNESSYQPSFNTVAPEGKDIYIVGIHPLHNPQRLFAVFSPLMVYLSERVEGASFQLEASRNYASYEKKLYALDFHFALPNPFQTINAIDKGYTVFAKMGDDENFRGIILVRKDTDISLVSELKGEAVSYPAKTALAATMMPQFFLQKSGVDVLTELDNQYVGSQESSIMSVFLGRTAAAATWPPPWNALRKERPELDQQLEIKWQTEALLNNAFLVRKDVSPTIIKQVENVLANLHLDDQGREILKVMELSKFELANNATYEPIRAFIVEFENSVRSLD